MEAPDHLSEHLFSFQRHPCAARSVQAFQDHRHLTGLDCPPDDLVHQFGVRYCLKVMESSQQRSQTLPVGTLAGFHQPQSLPDQLRPVGNVIEPVDPL